MLNFMMGEKKFDIDYVFPYVNNKEKVWVESFKSYCKAIGDEGRIASIDGERYGDFGLLPTLVRCIELNLPWVRRIHIIVSNPEQLPREVANDPKVHMVLHKDIIPERFLPTFNSTTIEMFLHSIDGLAEHFLYGNDDMIPLAPLGPGDFFSEDGGRIRMFFKPGKLSIVPTQFRKVCWNCCQTIKRHFGVGNELNGKEYIRPEHTITPMLKSVCSMVSEECKDDVWREIRAFRTSRQHNQYLYPDYMILSGLCDESQIRFRYAGFNRTLEEIVRTIGDKSTQVICLNDASNANRRDIMERKDLLRKAIEGRLPQGPKMPRCVVCCVAKNEHPYIDEWVRHHLSIGFDWVYIFDNDDTSSSQMSECIGEDIRGKVTIFNKRGQHFQRMQNAFYKEFYETHGKLFDWCLFCDVDEFLDGVGDVKSWLYGIPSEIEQVRVRWRLFGDDGIVERDPSLPVFGAFKEERRIPGLSNQGKCIVRGRLQGLIFDSVHYLKRQGRTGKGPIKSCLPSGAPCKSELCIEEDCSGESIFLNHYMTKSLSEFVSQKMGRGDACFQSRGIDLDYYWGINEGTPGKLDWLNEHLAHPKGNGL